MSGGRCERRKMMGRGAEGGCGTEEKTCPVSRVSVSHSPPTTTSTPTTSSADVSAADVVGARKAMDFYVQARKALQERCPFDTEEVPERVTTLPVALAVALTKHGDGRKKHKKVVVHAEHGKKAAPPSLPPPTPTKKSVWDETEEYFRDITLDDIDKLVRNLPSSRDSCFSTLILPVFLDKLGDGSLDGTVGGENLDAGNLDGTVGGENLDAGNLDEAVGGENLDAVPVVVVGETGVLELVAERTVIAAEEDPGCGAAVAEQENQLGMGTVVSKDEDDNNLENMDIDDDADFQGNDSGVGVTVANGSSLNWLLGSKHRAILTSERPNKKRKLLGVDAGLDRLLKLPDMHGEGEGSAMCDYCCLSGSASSSDIVLCCNSCNVLVHQKCYGVADAPLGSWLCSWCKHSDTTGRHYNGVKHGSCLLCPKKGGALKPTLGEIGHQNTDSMTFAHLFCSLWSPEVFVDDIKAMEPVRNVGAIQESRKKLVCVICKVKHGPCVRCSHGSCRAPFHPICARDAKNKMEIWGKAGCDNVELRLFCSKHSTFQDSGSVWQSSNGDVPLEDNHVSTRLQGRDKCPVEHNTKLIAESESPLDEDTSEVEFSPNVANAKVNQKMQTSDHVDSDASHDFSSYANHVLLLKKLIEKGRIKVSAVASEMGISSGSLEAALMGESNIVSSQLGAKIARWMKDSVHIAAPSGLRKKGNRDNSTLSAVADLRQHEVQYSNTAIDTTLEKSGAGQLPSSQGNKKSRPEVFEDDKIEHTLVNSLVLQNGGNNLIEGITESSCPSKDNKELGSTTSNSFVQDFSDQKTVSVIFVDAPKHSDRCLIRNTSQTEDPGNMASDISRDIFNQGGYIDEQSSFEPVINQTNDGIGRTVGGSPILPVVEPSFGLYVNPFIAKRLLQMENSAGETKAVKAANDGELNLSSVNLENVLDTETVYCAKNEKNKLENLHKAKVTGIMKLSPQDEVEGEILNLQNKLVDAALAIKHQCEVLMSKVATNIPEELDLLKQRRWDFLLVNRFLREVREAKKRGRKERRHREAQAILAAAVAATSSSRVSLLRKDTKDEALQVQREGPVAVESPSGTVGSPSHQLANEKPSKLTVSKMSHGKSTDGEVLSCDICRREDSSLNPVFVCAGCKVAVHLGCYRRCKDPISAWYCEPCEELRTTSSNPRLLLESKDKPCLEAHCGLCGAKYGAFRKSTGGQWLHAFCAEWTLESTFKRGQEQMVEGMDAFLKLKDMQTCCLCHRRIGICIKCDHGHCQAVFHPLCARTAGFYMHTKNVAGNLQHKAYCQKHSQEQKDKADSLSPGAEELRSIRQMRVELEKLRLLCERIIKREKLKRELVLTSHGVLSSKRDYAAFSVLVRSRALPTGVSSESATTSVNNTSYSETVERSDENTVDSNLSGKRKFILPSCRNTDRRLSERSRMHQPFMQKVTERASLCGKHLPRRLTPVASDNINEEENKPKSKKRIETFQKELLMTSDQASKQNRRLPKGFVYVPVDSLPNTEDVSHEPNKPDG